MTTYSNLRILSLLFVFSPAISLLLPGSSSFLVHKHFSSAIHATSGAYDYDVIIVGCGVGGHGAALHARANGLKTAVLTGGDVGGTCVNRGCVPSKALLAAAGKTNLHWTYSVLYEFL